MYTDDNLRRRAIEAAKEPKPRRQHRLATGRASRGYVPIEVETADSAVSNEALGLLVRIRRAADQRESDGVLDRRSLNALAAAFDLKPSRVAQLLKELVTTNLVTLSDGGVSDTNFLTWCDSHEEREAKRKDWRDRQDGSRAVSRHDTNDESRAVSQNTAAASASASPVRPLPKGNDHMRTDEWECWKWLEAHDMPEADRRRFLDDLRIEANKKTGGVRSLDAWATKPPAPGIVHVLEERWGKWRDDRWAREKQDSGVGLASSELTELESKLCMPVA